MRRQIDYVVRDCAPTMVVAAGVETQEYTYLSFEARKALIRSTVECVDRRVPVMVGITHPSFRTAIELAHEAEKLGAAALQLLAPLRPFAGAPTRADLVGYFDKISRETSLPLTLYLNPGPGAEVSIPDTIAHRQVAARAIYQGKLARSGARVAADRRDRPRRSRAIFHHHADAACEHRTRRRGRHHARRRRRKSPATSSRPSSPAIINARRNCSFNSRLFPGKWMHYGLAPTMKAAMNLIGVPVGDPYPPYAPIAGDDLAALAAYLKKHGARAARCCGCRGLTPTVARRQAARARGLQKRLPAGARARDRRVTRFRAGTNAIEPARI